jgi:SAM-dependent methyltransferase
LQWTNFFESLAELDNDDEFVTGRTGGHTAELASLIADDISTKLDLESTDSLLDFGSGTGAITRALATRVAAATAADSTAAIIGRGKAGGGEIDWVQLDDGGADSPLASESFKKVLSYSNAPTFTTHTQVREHVEALCRAVAPGGTVMLGDIPDRERSVQWESGERGRDENRTVWMGRLERRTLDIERDARNVASFLERLKRLGIKAPDGFGERHPGFDRDIVTRMFRETGGKVAVVNQPLNFPNSHTCVDYIVQFGS